jgi:hypothetical protein
VVIHQQNFITRPGDFTHTVSLARWLPECRGVPLGPVMPVTGTHSAVSLGVEYLQSQTYFFPLKMISVNILISAKGSRETAIGNSLNRTTGGHSPMAGKPRYARLDPR